MRTPYYKQAGVSAIDGRITEQEGGEFTAVASTDSVDRDGEVIAPGAFAPLPSSTIPVHLDHLITADNIVARARPYYVGAKLMIDATFGTEPDAQAVRRKVAEGLIDSVSIVFLGKKWEDRNGVRTLVAGDLLACDLVSVPSNPDARILSARSLRVALRDAVADARADALLAMAACEIADAKAYLAGEKGRTRRMVDAEVRSILDSPTHPRSI